MLLTDLIVPDKFISKNCKMRDWFITFKRDYVKVPQARN